MTNHPNRAVRRTARELSPEAREGMDTYVAWIFAECMGEDEDWPLGRAWQTADGSIERSHIAAAIVYRTHGLSDPPYRILEERGPHADPRLCAVADEQLALFA